MNDRREDRWVLPTEIPFETLKGKELEECLFWLLDGMGGRDLEWRVGGKGAGAADGGRDLEARFYEPNEAGEIIPRKWWIECKGRAGTLEKEAVTVACNNVLAYGDVDRLVIATNTTFSNPTRDWVRDWQNSHPRPQIMLWDRASLEQVLSQQPATVMRLFEGGLSLAGQLEALRERFWSLLEYSSVQRLRRLWEARDTLDIGVMERVALIANEFAHGDIDERPWCGGLEPDQVYKTCEYAFFNLLYLYTRLVKSGANSAAIIDTYAYLVMATIRLCDPKIIPLMMEIVLTKDDGAALPPPVVELLVLPIFGAIQSDLTTMCSADCDRFSRDDSARERLRRDPLDTFWKRFSKTGIRRQIEDKDCVRLQNLRAPCRIGFDLSGEQGCPLYDTEISTETPLPYLTVAAEVLRRRAPVPAPRSRGRKAQDQGE